MRIVHLHKYFYTRIAINILAILFTPPIAEILCVKNGRAIVVCGFLKIYAESLKKNHGSRLPAK